MEVTTPPSPAAATSAINVAAASARITTALSTPPVAVLLPLVVLLVLLLLPQGWVLVIELSPDLTAVLLIVLRAQRRTDASGHVPSMGVLWLPSVASIVSPVTTVLSTVTIHALRLSLVASSATAVAILVLRLLPLDGCTATVRHVLVRASCITEPFRRFTSGRVDETRTEGGWCESTGRLLCGRVAAELLRLLPSSGVAAAATEERVLLLLLELRIWVVRIHLDFPRRIAMVRPIEVRVMLLLLPALLSGREVLLELLLAHSLATTSSTCCCYRPTTATAHTDLCRLVGLSTRRPSCHTAATGRCAAATAASAAAEAARPIRCSGERPVTRRCLLLCRCWRGSGRGRVIASHDFGAQGRVFSLLLIDCFVPPLTSASSSASAAATPWALATPVALLPIARRYPDCLLRHSCCAPKDIAMARESHPRHLAGRCFVQRHRLAILQHAVEMRQHSTRPDAAGRELTSMPWSAAHCPSSTSCSMQ